MKRGPKRNKHQVASDRQKAAQLRADGLSFRAIAQEVGLDAKQVRLDLAFVDAQLIDTAKLDLERAKAETVAKFRFAQIEAVQAWRRSQEDAVKEVIKDGKDGLEESVTTEGQSGAPGHMNNFIKAVKHEAELLGLYKPASNEDLNLTEFEADLVEQLKAAREAHGTAKDIPVQPGAVPVSDPVDCEN